jgi:hypothetical protein
MLHRHTVNLFSSSKRLYGRCREACTLRNWHNGRSPHVYLQRTSSLHLESQSIVTLKQNQCRIKSKHILLFDSVHRLSRLVRTLNNVMNHVFGRPFLPYARRNVKPLFLIHSLKDIKFPVAALKLLSSILPLI